MKKALHGKPGVFYTRSKGRLYAWDDQIVEDVIDGVNKFAGETLEDVAYANKEQAFHDAMHDWFDKFLRDGVTQAMVEELNELLDFIDFRHVLRVSDEGELFWRPDADFKDGIDPDSSAAYVFAHMLTDNALKNLKQCQLDDCDNFFRGPPNAKFCSKSCGSLSRVRKKRKRDSY